MSIQVFVIGLQGSGKTHLMRKNRNHASTPKGMAAWWITDSQTTLHIWRGGPQVAVYEIQGTARRDDIGRSRERILEDRDMSNFLLAAQLSSSLCGPCWASCSGYPSPTGSSPGRKGEDD